MPIYDFGYHPLANKLLSHDTENAPQYLLRLMICYNCELVQLQDHGATLFTPDYPYESSVNKPYVEQCEAWAKTAIRRWELDPKHSKILEIACNDGYLLSIFSRLGFDNLSGVEPIPRLREKASHFGNVFPYGWNGVVAMDFGKYDLIIANNVMAHVSDLKGFIWGVAHCLTPNGLFSVEVQDFNRLAYEMRFDTIYHEHLCYFTSKTLERVCSSVGLKLVHMEKIPSHGGSMRLTFTPKESFRHKILNRDKRVVNVQRFRERVENKIFHIKNYLARIPKDYSIACFGAAAKGISLLNYCGIDRTKISFCADETISKQGKLMPGSLIPITGLEEIKRQEPNYLWVLAWNYENEIREKTRFIENWYGEHLVLH